MRAARRSRTTPRGGARGASSRRSSRSTARSRTRGARGEAPPRARRRRARARRGAGRVPQVGGVGTHPADASEREDVREYHDAGGRRDRARARSRGFEVQIISVQQRSVQHVSVRKIPLAPARPGPARARPRGPRAGRGSREQRAHVALELVLDAEPLGVVSQTRARSLGAEPREPPRPIRGGGRRVFSSDADDSPGLRTASTSRGKKTDFRVAGGRPRRTSPRSPARRRRLLFWWTRCSPRWTRGTPTARPRSTWPPRAATWTSSRRCSRAARGRTRRIGTGACRCTSPRSRTGRRRRGGSCGETGTRWTRGATTRKGGKKPSRGCFHRRSRFARERRRAPRGRDGSRVDGPRFTSESTSASRAADAKAAAALAKLRGPRRPGEALEGRGVTPPASAGGRACTSPRTAGTRTSWRRS